MKKIFLLFTFLLTVSVANAWRKNCEEGIVVLATQHLKPEVKSVIDSYLGTTYEDDVQYLLNLEKEKKAAHTSEIHFVHLDGRLNPKSVEGDDALVAIEKSLEVVRARNSHSHDEVVVALRTIINLMCDIHNLSHYRIDGIPYSYTPHKFSHRKYDYGKTKDEISTIKWSTFWEGYSGRYTGFSGEYWAYDMQLCRGKKFDEFSAGTLREWVVENGIKSAQYLMKFTPGYVMSPLERNQLENVNYDMMVRAAFRLAALLNSTIQ